MAGYLDVVYKGSLRGHAPPDFWRTDSTGRLIPLYTSPTIDPSTGFYDESGVESIWRDDRTKTFTFKGDLTSQVHPAHMIKTGLDFSYNTISYIDIQDGGTKLSKYGQGIDSIPPPGPFQMFGQNRWVFDVKPIIASAYIQDKFELEYLVINAGVRIDYFNLGKTVMESGWQTAWEAGNGPEGGLETGDLQGQPPFRRLVPDLREHRRLLLVRTLQPVAGTAVLTTGIRTAAPSPGTRGWTTSRRFCMNSDLRIS